MPPFLWIQLRVYPTSEPLGLFGKSRFTYTEAPMGLPRPLANHPLKRVSNHKSFITSTLSYFMTNFYIPTCYIQDSYLLVHMLSGTYIQMIAQIYQRIKQPFKIVWFSHSVSDAPLLSLFGISSSSNFYNTFSLNYIVLYNV